MAFKGSSPPIQTVATYEELFRSVCFLKGSVQIHDVLGNSGMVSMLILTVTSGMRVFLVGYTTLRLLFTVISMYPGHIVANVILLRAAQGSIPSVCNESSSYLVLFLLQPQ